ncbi:MAG: hypothetical protein JO036_20255 [Candidatus Eremiobacteraeota bacterium]|nr:hypothetical protein [Candidatus Eremiobacteraeota bacterium]
MSNRFEGAVTWVLVAGAVGCAAAALALRPAPLPATAGARWIALAARTEHEQLRTSWRLEGVDVAGRHVDYIGQVLLIERGEQLRLTGFALDPVLHRSGARLVYRVDAGPWREARYHLPRPDVATALGAPGAADSGFEAVLATGALAPGSHTLQLATATAPRVQRTLSPALPFVVE